MDTRFAFSLNGQNYQGSFASRREARSAALEAASQLQELPPVVYVGKILQTDSHSDNHAREVVRAMSRQARDIDGNDNYLSGLTVGQMSDLDHALTQAIDQWLDRNELRPAGFHVYAVSEYPVPIPQEVVETANQPAETDVSIGAGPGSGINIDPQS